MPDLDGLSDKAPGACSVRLGAFLFVAFGAMQMGSLNDGRKGLWEADQTQVGMSACNTLYVM